ncbi:MAG TPA: penicillin-insensitive murein endopeptidase, partial [Polyangiaceae bacterium]|nr:penicillin-insensitive murein endopeptidase [Polyangiaceae bacterium]
MSQLGHVCPSAPLRPSLRASSHISYSHVSAPIGWGAGVSRWVIGAFFSTLVACGPGFFARDAADPQDLAAGELDDAGPDPELLPKGPVGLGCSPKGCLEDAPVADEPAEVAPGAVAASVPPLQDPLASHPLLGKTNAEIEHLVRSDMASLGSMSFGSPTRGGLLNAVYLPSDARWIPVDPTHAWGTAETISYLTTAIDALHSEFPNSHPLFIGDLSRQRGGYLQPHLSHQSGKDVDISYFYTRDPKWYARATAANLDRPRTWAMLRILMERTDVQFIFVDRRLQQLLRSYAEAIGEDRVWLESVFDGIPGEPAIIRHEPGHDTHFHVRFFNPIADETARRCYTALIQQKRMLPMRYNITHKAQRGDTLSGIAKKYGTTVAALMSANGMSKSAIQANKTYVIPRSGPAAPAARLELPPRRVPPP